MKIAVAQTRSLRGDIRGNVGCHKRLIDLAIAHSAEIVIFPELSLTGYEPKLASELATDECDPRFDDFQGICDAKRITIGVGAPTKNNAGVCISLVLFQPNQARRLYSKQYLHPDEDAFFVRGPSSAGLIGANRNIALAICYELSIPEHAENAFSNGAEIYIASVAKTASGVAKAATRLAEIARTYSMTVLMANCVGSSEDGDCVGRTSAWDKRGALFGELDETKQGIIVVDTEMQAAIGAVLEAHCH